MRLNGWNRIWVVCSSFWVLFSVFNIANDAEEALRNDWCSSRYVECLEVRPDEVKPWMMTKDEIDSVFDKYIDNTTVTVKKPNYINIMLSLAFIGFILPVLAWLAIVFSLKVLNWIKDGFKKDS